MTRYIAIPNAPRAWATDHVNAWGTTPPSCTVHEADPTPQPIGLLDADGTPIYRVQEQVAFGFQPNGRRGEP